MRPPIITFGQTEQQAIQRNGKKSTSPPATKIPGTLTSDEYRKLTGAIRWQCEGRTEYNAIMNTPDPSLDGERPIKALRYRDYADRYMQAHKLRLD